MKTFLFTSAPLFSHLDWGGYLKTAQALVQRGHRVVWAMEPGGVAEQIRRVGVTVAEVPVLGFSWSLPEEPHDYLPESWAAYRLRRNFNTWLPENTVAQGVEALISLAREYQAQVLVSDPFLAAAALASEAMQLPYAIVGMPATSPVEKTWLPAEAAEMKIGMARLDALCEQFKIEGKHFIQLNAGLWPHSPDLHLSYFTQSWYDWRDEPVLAQNKFVGGVKAAVETPPPSWLAQLPDDMPIIYITLGRTFNYEPEFFYTALKAVSSLGAYPAVATYDTELTQALKAAMPAELALIENALEMEHLFPRLRGLIQHGGPGTTHAAILYALPQMIVAPGPGQGTQAHLVSRAGIGKFLHLEEITLENLRTLATTVLSNPQFKAQAEVYQAQFAAGPGIAGGADWLETLC